MPPAKIIALPKLVIPVVPPRRLLSEELQLLAERFATRPARLGEVVEVVQGRGYTLVLILLCLPFLLPVPLPLLSTVFGSAIALIGFRLSLGQKPRLPESFLQRQLPAKFFPMLLKTSIRIVRLLESVLRPRMKFFHQNEFFRRLGGVLILLCGLKLLLPLPVPMSNFLPAAAALIIAASELENDGLFFLIGCALFAVSTLFFVLLAIGGTTAVQALWPGS